MFGYPLNDAVIVAYETCLSDGSDFDAIDLIFLFDEDFNEAVETLENHIDGVNQSE